MGKGNFQKLKIESLELNIKIEGNDIIRGEGRGS